MVAVEASADTAGAAAMTRPLPRLRVYPAVADNPYQGLLYSAFRGVARLDMTSRPQLMRRFGIVPRAEVLHFHWEDGSFWGVTNDRVIRRRLTRVQRMLARHRAQGGRLVWTLHNERPHREGERHEGFLALRRHLAAQADMIHVHSEAARHLLLADWPQIDEARVEVIGHPSYVGVYAPANPAPAPVKAGEGARLLFFGSLNAYKGVDTLIDCLGRDGLGGVVTRLTVAGSSILARRKVIREALADVAYPVDLHMGRVPDNRVADLFRGGAEFCVLPYRHTLTSGVAHLALTFGLPVIAPAIGGMRETVPAAAQGLLYDPDAPDGLAQAIRRAAALSSDDYAAMSAACLTRSADTAPALQSQRLAQAMQRRGIL